ncbi:MAG TPA: Asp-tRNA(Asn)/Glu-tRNA(Gln) amidotransferase subunit GatA [Ktedonobacteraceae bacterium]|nr:Asp-tRNA(Asn)/Glu-tRNA(Gln) amidotransferase subunit GatA [Ktedonobacteraceae bacterium]
MKLYELTITEARKGLQEKKFSSRELTSACLERMKAIEPKVHAFVTFTEEQALEQAQKADFLIESGDVRPLLGVPISIKDNFCTNGVRTTASSNVLRNFVPPYDATVVRRVTEAGAISLGKTNMDAFAHGSSTEASDFGPTRNPWNIERLPGGSSGGAAASVAADEAIAAVGSETAGSIRQPAAWCGVVGLKPTYGRVSRYGVIAMASSLDSPGPITKSVEDAALMLEVLAGHDPMDATTSPLPPKAYRKLLKEKRENLTIGISDDYFNGVDPEIVAAVQKSLQEFERLGHKVKKIKLFDPQYAIAVYTILQRSEVSSNLARYDGIRYGFGREAFGEEAQRRIMLGTYSLSAGYYDAYYAKAQKVRTLIVEDFAKAFEEVDVVIGPTSPSTALPVGSSKDHPMFGEISDVLVEPSTIAGLPGISMCCGFSSELLPISMQIIGPYFIEDLILNLAYQYEQVTDWSNRKPNL